MNASSFLFTFGIMCSSFLHVYEKDRCFPPPLTELLRPCFIFLEEEASSPLSRGFNDFFQLTPFPIQIFSSFLKKSLLLFLPTQLHPPNLIPLSVPVLPQLLSFPLLSWVSPYCSLDSALANPRKQFLSS